MNSPDFLDDINYEDYDNIREPLPIIREKIINTNDDFLQFKDSILLDENLDEEMKEILIKSRQDFIKDFVNKNTYNPIIEEKSKIFSILSLEIVKRSKNNFIFKDLYPKIERKINNFINDKINEIKLDFEDYYEIEKLINELTINEENKNKLLSIIKPDNREEYINYKNIINISIQEDNDFKEKEKLKDNEIKKRKNLLNSVLLNIKKLSGFDKSIKKLNDDIKDSISDYLNLITDRLILQDDIKIEFIKFINSIRIESEKKNKIISLT